MGISVNKDLAGCVVFLVPLTDKIDNATIEVAEKLMSRGAIKIETLTMEQACYKFAEIQQRHGNIPTEQRFLKVTPKGGIIKLFL